LLILKPRQFDYQDTDSKSEQDQAEGPPNAIRRTIWRTRSCCAHDLVVLMILIVDSEAKGNSIIKTRVQNPNKIKPKDRQMLYAVLFGGHDLVALMILWCS
jgi:hypothetical protein